MIDHHSYTRNLAVVKLKPEKFPYLSPPFKYVIFHILACIASVRFLNFFFPLKPIANNENWQTLIFRGSYKLFYCYGIRKEKKISNTEERKKYKLHTSLTTS